MHIDRSRLLRLLLAGAFAGFVIFCIFDPGVAKEEADSYRFGSSEAEGDPAAVFLSMTMFGAAFAAMIGGMLALADEIYSPPKRVAIRMGIAVAVGLTIGAIAGLISQAIFGSLVATSALLVIPARIVSWATFGFGAGAGLGAALGSWRRAMMCMLGGLVGGCIAGGLFDMICAVTGLASVAAGGPPTGSLGRFIGFVLMGIAVGVTVAFVEDIAKQSWVTVLSGPKEGRSFILSKPVTTIGRDELADIPLFGDMSVAKQHAALHMQGNAVTLQAIGGPVAVNGAAVQTAALRPWDTFSVGRWSLRFHQKGVQPTALGKSNGAQVSKHPYLSDSSVAAAEPAYAPPQVTISQPAARAVTGNLLLVATAGPHLNQRFSFGPGTVRIGREVGCAVLLASDPTVSRNHAELTWNGSSWIARDLGSRNGLWVNGVRVTEHPLNVGDQIGVGQTVLRVEGS